MKAIGVITLAFLLLPFSKLEAQTYNYAEALQKSLYFYDAEKSGPGITGGKLTWRGNSEPTDMVIPLNATKTNMSQTFINANKAILDPDNNGSVDVSGGYHDAGDHVKFGLPQSYSSSTLEWALYEFKPAFLQTGEYTHMKELMKWFSDYYLRSTFFDATGKVVAFCYQVGEGNQDHNFWGPPEIQDATLYARPGYFATTETPASDQCAGAAASLALSYLNNLSDDPTYANRCLTAAKALYDFAVLNRGLGYSGGFYNSSFDEDELAWAAIWLYIATTNQRYLTDIISKDASGKNTGWLKKIIISAQDSWQNIWVHSWDTKWGGIFSKLAPITNDPLHLYILRWNLEFWSGVAHQNANDNSFLVKTPAGFSFLNSWGSARYNAAAQFQALVYKKYYSNSDFDAWTQGQMQYIMGNNPLNRSYIVGYSANAAKHPHHRAAHGSATNSMFDPVEHKHILWGALVGGPGAKDEHNDATNDFVYNEVAIDYNAGLVGALAGLYTYFGQGQKPLINFPPDDPALTQFSVEAKIEQENKERSQISIRVTNESAFPPRREVLLKTRYFFNISEMIQVGQTISDVSFAVYYDQQAVTGPPVTATGPFAWDASNGVYYMEFAWPQSGFYGKREYQFGLIAKQSPTTFTSYWDPTNDYSHTGLGAAYALSQYLPLYVDGKLYSGNNPGSAPTNQNPIAKATANVTSGNPPLAVTFNASASIDPDADVLTFAWTFGDGTTGTGVKPSKTYTTAGSFTATVTVTDGKGGVGTASVVITVRPTGSTNCAFGTPTATALPSVNKSFTKIYVLGTGGPALNNITNLTINWDLQQNGLWQFSANTSNGQPNWYVDLRTVSTKKFNQPQPDVTFTNSGFTGLDGAYWVTLDAGNLALVSKAGSFTLYFSNTATPPVCGSGARIAAIEEVDVEQIKVSVYPNPFNDMFTISLGKPELVTGLFLHDQLGRVVIHVPQQKIKSTVEIRQPISKGIYILKVQTISGDHTIKILKE